MGILEKDRRKMVDGYAARFERPPTDFKRPYNATTGLVVASAMGGAGVLIGGNIGIAALGTAVSGAWVLAPVLAVIGFLVGSRGGSSE